MKKLFAFSLATTLFCGSLFGLMLKSGLFKVSHIVVVPSKTSTLFTEHQPQMAKKLEIYKNQNIWNVNVSEIADQVSAQAWVKDVRVRRIFPSTIRVEIGAKEVIAAVVTNRGQVIPLTREAESLPALPLRGFPDVPIIRDHRILKNSKLKNRAIEILRELPTDGPLSQFKVAEISSDKDEQFWLSLIEDQAQIKIGSSNIPLRAARIEKVLEYLRNNKLHARVIDADFSKKVVVKLRKDR